MISSSSRDAGRPGIGKDFLYDISRQMRALSKLNGRKVHGNSMRLVPFDGLRAGFAQNPLANGEDETRFLGNQDGIPAAEHIRVQDASSAATLRSRWSVTSRRRPELGSSQLELIARDRFAQLLHHAPASLRMASSICSSSKQMSSASEALAGTG